jgi:hypothetical protein
MKLSSESSVLPAKPQRVVLVGWALMATLNLSAGIVIASWPERQTDLDSMRRWGREWLVDDLHVYALPDELTTYPPHALVVLSPLGAIPRGWAVPLWAAVNLGLAVTAPYLAVRAVRPMITLSSAALPILMLLCWGGYRTLLQFSLLTLTFGLAAMVLADRRPGWCGLCLGMALMKPQIGAPFFLWAVFTRRLRTASVGMAVVIAGLALFCLRAQVDPVDLVRQYARNYQTLYMGEPIVVGLSQLSPLLAAVISNTTLVDAVGGTIAISLLIAICILGFHEGKRRNALMISAPPLAGIWSLLTFYHLTYGFLLLLPTATLLIFANDPRTVVFRRRLFWALQLGLMVDVPGMGRRFGGYVFEHPEAAQAILIHVDRVLMLALFVCVMALALKFSVHLHFRAGTWLASFSSVYSQRFVRNRPALSEELFINEGITASSDSPGE